MHTFVNELERPVGTHLYGRRMYEVMVVLGDGRAPADQPYDAGLRARFGRRPRRSSTPRRWRTASSARTRIERDFDPEAVRQMKASAERDLSVGGPELAAQAFRAGLVDECQLFLAPIVVGGGKQSLPDDVRVELELLDERRFGNGMVYLHYRSGT